MQELYQWIDDIPLSRPKRSISRDFSDGVLAAELVAHFFPKLVDLHNYSAANSVSQKQYNWATLNQKVFKKMGFQMPPDQVKSVCECTPGAIEQVLLQIHTKINQIQANGGKMSSAPKPPQRRPEVPASAPQVKQPKKKAPLRQPASQPVPRNRQHRPAQSEPPQQRPDRGARQHVEEQAQEFSRPTYNIPLTQPASARQPVQQPAPKVNMMTELDRSLKSEHREVPEIADLDTEILVEKESTIQELRETVLILETKVQKMEQLLRLKDQKINKLQSTLDAARVQ